MRTWRPPTAVAAAAKPVAKASAVAAAAKPVAKASAATTMADRSRLYRRRQPTGMHAGV